MIIAVPPPSRHLVKRRLKQMHRLRHDVCAEQWGWRFEGQIPDYDIDAFDTDATVYLLYIDDARDDVIACCRFNPTTSPYMVSELWSEQCDLQEPPRDPAIWEASRFVISRHLSSKAEYMEILWRMCVGTCEYCVTHGIKAITWYTGPAFYQTINSLVPVEPLGRPYYDPADDDTYIPGIGYISEASIKASRANLSDPDIPLTFVLSPDGNRQGIYPPLKKQAA